MTLSDGMASSANANKQLVKSISSSKISSQHHHYLTYAENIKGTILGGKYKIGNKIDGGSFGMIYDCTDLTDAGNTYVVKVSTDMEVLCTEIEALIDI